MQVIDQSPNAPTPLDQMRAAESLKSKVREIINRNPISMGNIVEAPGAASFPMAQRDQSGLALVNLSSPHYGQLVFNQVADTAEYAKVTGLALTNGNIDMSKATGGTSGAGIINHTTGYIDDTAGLGNTATFGQISSLPTTRAGYGITDAQLTLGNASGVQVLEQNSGGGPYWANKYGNELNGGGWYIGQTSLSSTVGTYVQVGNTVGIHNPGQSSLFCLLTYSGFMSPGVSSAIEVEYYLSYSVNGGSTYTNTNTFYVSSPNGYSWPTGAVIPLNLTSITGDVLVKVFATVAAGTTSPATVMYSNYLGLLVLPNNNAYELAGALSASIPTTASGNCSAYYPTTTCAASANITCTPSGGAGGNTFSWTKVSGTGTITNSTSQTCTVTDTETTSDAGATYNTVVNCTVTDSALSTATSGNCTFTGTFTRLYNPIVVSVPTTASGGCNTSINCGALCTASVNVTATPSGGDGSYSYSWTRVSGSTFVLTNTTSATVTVSYQTNTTHPATALSETIKCTVTDGHSSTGSANCAVTLNFQCVV